MTTLLLVALVLTATGIVAAWCCAERALAFLLAWYVLAFGEIVLVSLALSPADALSRGGYLAATAAVLAAVLVLAAVRRPPRPALGAGLRALVDTLREPLLAFTGAVGLLSLGYAVALGLLTAPNDEDALTYHLTRAAAWLQQGHVGHVPFMEDPRVSGFPPGAETIDALLLAGSSDDRLVALPQVLAVLALCCGVVLVARRLGLSRREALYGALLLPTLPIVALQSQSALNDLPVAALVVASVALALERTGAALAVSSLALALALLTKLNAELALPVVVAVVAVAWWPRWRPVVLWLGAACAAGAAWFAYNLAAGNVLGGDYPNHTSSLGVLAPVARLTRILVGTVEVPGAIGRDRLLFPLAGVLLAVALGAAWRSWRPALAAGSLVAAVPLLLVVNSVLHRAYVKTWLELGQPQLARLDGKDRPEISQQNVVGFGPVALLLVALVLVVVVREVRSRRLPPVALVLAAAPLALMLTTVVLLGYNDVLMRFTIAGVALAAATWGVALRVRPVAWAASVAAALVSLLVWVHFVDKPSGIRLLDRSPAPTSVFALDRIEVQSVREGLEPVLRFLAADVPGDATVAVWPASFPRGDDFESSPDLLPYLVYGARLGRSVVQARGTAAAERAGAQWYLAPSASLTGPPCVPGWRTRLAGVSGWTALQRDPAVRCGL